MKALSVKGPAPVGVGKTSITSPVNDLDGWILASADGRQFIGRVDEERNGRMKLSPCYAYQCVIQKTMQGISVERAALPIDLFCSVNTAWIAPNVSIDLSKLSPDDAKTVRDLIAKAESVTAAGRAAAVGITLASVMPK